MRTNLAALSALLVALALPAPAAAAPVVVISAQPGAISPDGDGNRDASIITVTLDVPSELSVVVLDAGGPMIRTLGSGPVPLGDSTFAWDGTDALGAVVPDGTFRVVATADDGSGATAAETTVTVDTRAPRLRWRGIAPEPVTSNHEVHFRFETQDASERLRITLTISDDEGEIDRVEEERRAGDAALDWLPRYRNGEPILPGLYEARLAVVDEAGNRTQGEWRAFRDHRAVHSKVFHRVGGTGPRVALTFDDCGDGGAWGRILRILDDRNVHASFFCLGPYVKHYRAQARRTIADGHTIGSHSTNHALETRLSFAEIVRQNRAPQAAWWKVAHVTPAPFFRPPYGGYDAEVLRAVGSVGYARTVIWDVDPRDWERPGPAVIADRVVAHSHAGSIVVMHALDGTAAALPSIISRLRAKGLEPVSLAELFHATGMRQPEDAGPVLADPYE